jgi:hypothetical protein
MSEDNELRELRERIGRLPFGQQLYLFETALADNRRHYAEVQAQTLAADAAFREAERRRREAEQTAEAKRAAG